MRNYNPTGSQIYTVNQWLNSRGGRTARDLIFDEIGSYVIMTDGFSRDVKIYLPNNLLR